MRPAEDIADPAAVCQTMTPAIRMGVHKWRVWERNLPLFCAITILLICLSGGVPELPQNGLKYILNSPNSPSPQVPSREKGERPKRGEK